MKEFIIRKLKAYLKNSWVIVLFAVFGVCAYWLFDDYISGGIDNAEQTGIIMFSFLFLLPLFMGAIFSFTSYKKPDRSPMKYLFKAISSSLLPLFLFIILSFFILGEGTVCIVLVLPLSIGATLIGSGIGTGVSYLFSRKNGKKIIILFAFIPFITGGIEKDIDLQNSITEVRRSVYIDAAPEIIWHHINYPTDIKPSELSQGFAYKIGVPYPIEAVTLEPRIGGKRRLVWQRGIVFEEEIIAWEENKHIAWKYLFSDESFPKGSLDDHVVIGGKYFDLEDTSYTIVNDAGRTRLDISVKFRVSTSGLNWYAVPWAKFLISDTADTILNFYKNRSEKSNSEII